MPDLTRSLGLVAPDARAIVEALLLAAGGGRLRAFCLVPGEGSPTAVLTESGGRRRLSLEPSRRATLVAKLKKLAGLDVAQRLRPQRGGFRTTFGEALSVSVTTRPCRGGEIIRVRFRRS
jgi:hypothetical protein